MMNLKSVGLKLEADIFHEESDTRAFIATNIAPQVDGDADSIIVVAFRGTASITNLKTDFTWNQESLSDIISNGSSMESEFEIRVTKTLDSEYGSCPVVSVKRNNIDVSENILRNGANRLLKVVPITRQAYPQVHIGFQQTYCQIRNDIITKILEVYQRQLTKAVQNCSHGKTLKLPKIYVTGHSLGGALGQLLALDLSRNVELSNVELNPRDRSIPIHKRTRSSTYSTSETIPLSTRARCNSLPTKQIDNVNEQESINFVHQMLSGTSFDKAIEKRRLKPPIAMYSYGQPRVGNHAFVRFYKQNVPHTFRIVAEDDLITALPFATYSGLYLYKHAGLEVALENGCTGNILVGPTVIETMLRFSKVRTSLQAHLLDNYRKCIESALSPSELQEFYQYRCSSDHSFRGRYNTSDVLPDWVTDVNYSTNQSKSSFELPEDWIANDDKADMFGPDWAR